MKLFFLKLFWQLLPIAIVLILLTVLYFVWVFWLKDFWKAGTLKRLFSACISALLLCSCMIVLLGFSTQSKLPFGQKINAISEEQDVAKAQKEIVNKLDSAILVANDQKYRAEDVAIETITPDWLASHRAKIDSLSDPKIRESYAKRFDNIENYFYPD